MANGVGSAIGRSKRDQMPKQIRLNAFEMNCVAHQSPGLWTHPRDRADRYNTLDYWVELTGQIRCVVPGGRARRLRRVPGVGGCWVRSGSAGAGEGSTDSVLSII